MECKKQNGGMELLCARPSPESKTQGQDKQHGFNGDISAQRFIRHPSLMKRMAASIICIIMLVSTPAGLVELAISTFENTAIAGIIVSLESQAHGDISFNSSDFLAYITAKRLKSGLPGKPEGNNIDIAKPLKPEIDNSEDGGLIDIPINQGPFKSVVSRLDADKLGLIEPAALTINPASASGYDFYRGVYILNNTNFNLDISSLLASKINFGIKTTAPTVLILHTHTSEAYTPTILDTYQTTENDRSDDKKHNVVRVGDEIKKVLESYGIGVIHITKTFDTPYSGAYGRSLETVEQYISLYPSIKVVLDIHRDALNDAYSPKYKLVTEINGKKAAQIMLVIGTDQSGDNHPQWRENLKLAVQIQREMATRYKLLARPIKLTKSGYNQFVSQGAMIVEVGANGNSLEEAIYGGKLFAASLSSVLSSNFD